MESQWTPETSKSDFRGQKSIASIVLYIIEKILERKCLKWAPISHLDIWNTSYGQKKGRESNCQFDSRPQKVGNWPDLLRYRGHVTYHWKALNKNYNFALDHIAIWGLFAKLWGSKVARVPFGTRFRDSHSGIPGEKNHLDVRSMVSHRVYYEGEGGGFPQVRAMVNLVCPCCPWFVLTPKVFQLCTNHFVWVVCRLSWMSEACQFFLVPSRSSNTILYPSKCCELGSVPRLFPLPLSSTWTHIWVLPRVGSASIGLKFGGLTKEIMFICIKQHQVLWMWLQYVLFYICGRFYLQECSCWRVKMVKHGRTMFVIVHHVIFTMWWPN